MAAIMNSAILNLAILDSAIFVFPLKLTHTCQNWFPSFVQKNLHSHYPPHHLHKKNFTHSFWLNLMMVAIFNSAILNSANLDSDFCHCWNSDTLLSSLRFTQKHSPSTLTLTQTNSFWFKLDSWQLISMMAAILDSPCAFWNSDTLFSSLSFTQKYSPSTLTDDSAILNSTNLDSWISLHALNPTHTCQDWWPPILQKKNVILTLPWPNLGIRLNHSSILTQTHSYLLKIDVPSHLAQKKLHCTSSLPNHFAQDKTSLIHSDSTWWWWPSGILPSWILPSWISASAICGIKTPCFLPSDSLPKILSLHSVSDSKLIHSASNSLIFA